MLVLLPVVLLGLASLAGPPSSHVPDRFYNRPLATQAMKAAAIAQCRQIVTGPNVMVEQRQLTPPSDPQDFPRELGGSDQSLESCMVTRGWRVFELSPRDRAALARLSPQARARALGRLTGARRPAYGRLVRDGSALQLRDPTRR